VAILVKLSETNVVIQYCSSICAFFTCSICHFLDIYSSYRILNIKCKTLIDSYECGVRRLSQMSESLARYKTDSMSVSCPEVKVVEYFRVQGGKIL